MHKQQILAKLVRSAAILFDEKDYENGVRLTRLAEQVDKGLIDTTQAVQKTPPPEVEAEMNAMVGQDINSDLDAELSEPNGDMSTPNGVIPDYSVLSPAGHELAQQKGVANVMKMKGDETTVQSVDVTITNIGEVASLDKAKELFKQELENVRNEFDSEYESTIEIDAKPAKDAEGMEGTPGNISKIRFINVKVSDPQSGRQYFQDLVERLREQLGNTAIAMEMDMEE